MLRRLLAARLPRRLLVTQAESKATRSFFVSLLSQKEVSVRGPRSTLAESEEASSQRASSLWSSVLGSHARGSPPPLSLFTLQINYKKKEGGWQAPQIRPFGDIKLHPAAKVFLLLPKINFSGSALLDDSLRRAQGLPHSRRPRPALPTRAQRPATFQRRSEGTSPCKK